MKGAGYRILSFLGVLVLIVWAITLLPWGEWFSINRLSKEKREQLSDYMLRMHSHGSIELTDAAIRQPVLDIRNRICSANSIDTTGVMVHVFESPEVNAAAIPMGHILVYSGLIKECDNPEMLAGVMAHEIAHIRLNHIGKRFAREVTIASVISILGENTGLLMGIIRSVTSNAFDRSQESEADAVAMDYLRKANIDPRPTAAFFKKLSKMDNAGNGIPEWVSTHPQPAKRAAKILSAAKDGGHYTSAVEDETWTQAKASLPAND